jgi:hypothetical protein
MRECPQILRKNYFRSRVQPKHDSWRWDKTFPEFPRVPENGYPRKRAVQEAWGMGGSKLTEGCRRGYPQEKDEINIVPHKFRHTERK